jgi:transcriptional regulator with XRE-family HTH domain
MTATMLQPEDVARANALAIEIGDTFHRARRARGHTIRDVALRLGMSPRSQNNIVQFEQGAVTGVGLDTALRYLALYGYRLAIVKDR